MSDENERSVASDGSVAELLETIAAFMDQTDRFKGGAVPVVTPEATRARVAVFRLRKLLDAAPPQHALTAEEQEAIQAAAVIMDARNRLGLPVMFRGSERAATLRGLLERMEHRQT